MPKNSFQEYLERVHAKFIDKDDGAVASYIPELMHADPAWFGIALITVDGHVYQVGDSQHTFTIQSISKAITYGLALEDNGISAVLRKVDVEPSGEAFNSISLESGTGRPRNPMLNAGAIATVGLLRGDNGADKFGRLLKCFENYLGRTVRIDPAVYQSEKSTGHRNRAIAYLLRNSNIIEADPDDVLDAYFKQCSILVSCQDLALIGATLANDGVNPITGVRALRSPYVAKTLSVMSSCGMYDYSGAWVYEIGMPAKSGVGGGIVAVLPGQFGLAVFSPRLDDRGNSTRGIAVCREISGDFGLHPFHTGSALVANVVHASYAASEIPSNRTRSRAHAELLAHLGTRARVLELQGDLIFSTAEIVIREAMAAVEQADYLTLDFTRVGIMNQGAVSLLIDLIKRLLELDKVVLLTGVASKYGMMKLLRRGFPSTTQQVLFGCIDVDHALEWCENALLAETELLVEREMPLANQPFCANFNAAELAFFETLLERHVYKPQAHLCHEGDAADCLFFIIAGQVSVRVALGADRTSRIGTFSAGSACGEMGMLDRGGKRSANMVADTEVTCLILHYQRLETEVAPPIFDIRLKLVTNIAAALTHKLRLATSEIKLLRS